MDAMKMANMVTLGIDPAAPNGDKMAVVCLKNRWPRGVSTWELDWSRIWQTTPKGCLDVIEERPDGDGL